MSGKSVVHIVDDEDAVRTSLATLLEIHGFSTRVYQSGNEFLSKVDPAVPGCALVDLRMPGLDGIGLLQKMAESNIRVPVVMMTGFGEVATAVKAMKAGAADFLEKPLDEAELLTILNRLVANSQVSAELEELKAQGQARLRIQGSRRGEDQQRDCPRPRYQPANGRDPPRKGDGETGGEDAFGRCEAGPGAGLATRTLSLEFLPDMP